ncbi:MAG: hypothetical protein U1F43_21540 [Myxococcota bacterium]
MLRRWTEPLPIRSRGAFQLISARRVSDGERCVLVLPGPSGAPARVAEAFAEVERVHAWLDHPLIPPVTARDVVDGTPVLELGCAATFDGIELIRSIAESGRKVAYGAADAFLASLRGALEAGHALAHAATGQPICMGRIGHGNVLFDRSGRWWLIGFGRNLPLEKDDGAIDGSWAFFQAPEMLTGGAASPSGDYVALLQFGRSLLSYVDVSATAIGRLLRGQSQPSDAELLQHVRWVEKNIVAELPPFRPSVAEAVRVAERIRELAGVVLDKDGFARFVAELMRDDDVAAAEAAGAVTEPASAEPPALTMAPDGSLVVTAEGEQKVGRALRRLLLALVERHTASAEPLTTAELLEAGWPGERPIYEAGLNRVYVSMNRLRQLGLRHVVERADEGYRLKPGTSVRVLGAAAHSEKM